MKSRTSISKRISTKYWYSKRSKRGHVSKLEFILLSLFHKIAGSDASLSEFNRMVSAANLPLEPSFQNDSDLPAIELTIDCAEKDLHLLSAVINKAVLNSLNPIMQISVIVPNKILAEATMIDFEIEPSLIKIISEDEIISEKLRTRIREVFPERYGWVLHQFLTLEQIYRSKFPGILTLDSDTFLLSPMAWLSKDRSQILMESFEYHPPYYNFLKSIHPNFSKYNSSHVTHFSFFQRNLFLQIMNKLQIETLDDLFDYILKYAKMEDSSPFCIDREIYAYGILTYFPEKIELIKFSNKEFPIRKNAEFPTNELQRISLHYSTASSHSYLSEISL